MKLLRKLFNIKLTSPNYVTIYIDMWHKLLTTNEQKISWVVFENGTVVIINEQTDYLKAEAIDLMKEWGPVHAGCSAGDFSTLKLDDFPGWLVTSHHTNILTYVDNSEVKTENKINIMEDRATAIGLYGRNKRDLDAKKLNVIHIDNNY